MLFANDSLHHTKCLTVSWCFQSLVQTTPKNSQGNNVIEAVGSKQECGERLVIKCLQLLGQRLVDTTDVTDNDVKIVISSRAVRPRQVDTASTLHRNG